MQAMHVYSILLLHVFVLFAQIQCPFSEELEPGEVIQWQKMRIEKLTEERNRLEDHTKALIHYVHHPEIVPDVGSKRRVRKTKDNVNDPGIVYSAQIVCYLDV